MPLSSSRESIAAPQVSAAGAIQSLYLYGAAAVTSLGWAMGQLLEFDPNRLLPLWFFGLLLIYNIDRLRADPADAINLPARESRRRALSPRARWIAGLSVAALLLWPLLLRDLTLLMLVVTGACLSLSYSLPRAGARAKDLPFLKTLIPPTMVAAAYLVPPTLSGDLALTAEGTVAAAWVWLILLANMLLCDLRDILGDKAAGVCSLPVALNRDRTLIVVSAIGIASGLLASTAAHLSPTSKIKWLLLSVACPAYILFLCLLARRPRNEPFYEWWVEGLFLLPPALVSLTTALS